MSSLAAWRNFEKYLFTDLHLFVNICNVWQMGIAAPSMKRHNSSAILGRHLGVNVFICILYHGAEPTYFAAVVVCKTMTSWAKI